MLGPLIKAPDSFVDILLKLAAAYDEGKKAFHNGDANPYDPDSGEYARWKHGYDEANKNSL